MRGSSTAAEEKRQKTERNEDQGVIHGQKKKREMGDGCDAMIWGREVWWGKEGGGRWQGKGVNMERKRTRDLDAVDGAVGGQRKKEMMLRIQRIGAR